MPQNHSLTDQPGNGLFSRTAGPVPATGAKAPKKGLQNTIFQWLGNVFLCPAASTGKSRSAPDCFTKARHTMRSPDILFSPTGRLLTTVGQVLAYFCTPRTFEEAQDKLWQWVHPVLMQCLREQDDRRADQLAAFYEELEHRVSIIYHMRRAGLHLKPPPGKA
ncbi:hypothetical protein FVR03_17750 [Pontibacter qinzhouensis]|uniref:Uncharacterized protein n=1 Tax=Pontibacter qinzhouensis TaxID=2603253 RepID=A0A5C8JHB0_9BACT|nr:hypothetical protein [Pontibacter qinzhouensis]TXK36456.1 hypothetical protein FVR03_17750 [Pontibacter qinzhouensis]